jgi:carboxyl-terminal processing protease
MNKLKQMINKRLFYPVVVVFLIVGIVIGMKIQDAVSDDKLTAQVKKYYDVLTLASKYYVDDIDSQKLTEAAIRGLLSELDPHSIYISADQLKRVNEDFQGSFEGIGVEFDILNDTLTVITPISGGPSEKLGILAGDKIISIDGQSAIKISREDVPKKLKGPKGTKVTVNIVRPGMNKSLSFDIIRDKIPIYSVDASLMYNNEIGYIKVSRFSATTYDEFSQAMNKLKGLGMKKLVLDLRDNPGGFLDQAVKMASEFIPGGKKIVYTKSRINDFNEEYNSIGGKSMNLPLIVLVNSGSASASEIVSGAVQDLDRGILVGETTYGKGLVQRQFDLSDGSAVRVTTARYYTPDGRSIQKPYDKGKYDADLVRNENEGENIYHKSDISDSSRPIFKTPGGRTLYGGGGITPDYIIKTDTLTNFTIQLRRLNLFNLYVNNYMINNKSRIESGFKNYKDFVKSYNIDESMLNDLIQMAVSKGVEIKHDEYNRDLEFIKTSLKTQIARDIWGNEGSYAVWISFDKNFNKAITLFGDAEKLAGLKN